jgi:hypothetical protein
MTRRGQINSDPVAPRLRSKVAAAGEPVRAATEPVRAAAWKLEQRYLWRAADWIRGQAEAVKWPLKRIKWPLERIAWVAEQRVIWPLADRTAGSGRIVGAGALAALAVAVTAIGIVALSGSDGSPPRVVESAPVTATATPPPAAPETAAKPVLRGAPPSFEIGDGVGVTGTAAERSEEIGAGTSIASAPSSGEAGATTSSREAVPAGPAAMKVARRFADAFVFYEIGERPELTAAVFAETTSRRLAAALEDRPPRQPAGVEVPQARVLNLVPGPRSGRAYSVSASLLRLGTTSELRLQIEKKNGSWVVTDVRG